MPKNLKSYEVTITAYATVLVLDAESEDKALEYALDAVNFGDFEHDESSIRKELKTSAEIQRCREHAQAVAEE